MPELTDISKLDEEILSNIAQEANPISIEEINDILDYNGYSDPFFDHYFYSGMEMPSYNVYVNKLYKDFGTSSEAKY